MKNVVTIHYAIYSPEEFYYVAQICEHLNISYRYQIGNYDIYVECLIGCTQETFEDIELCVANECIPFA